uniref:Uncharacterized protein n=1 Tax=Setaria viridis TaxID=4556 RepID=A0A4U6VA13_SETVI|nr:hypothetical protein SEVIR_3G107150v2 [Setaria viridis]
MARRRTARSPSTDAASPLLPAKPPPTSGFRRHRPSPLCPMNIGELYPRNLKPKLSLHRSPTTVGGKAVVPTSHLATQLPSPDCGSGGMNST